MRKIVLFLSVLSFAGVADAAITKFEINGNKSAFTLSACGEAPMLLVHAEAEANLSPGYHSYNFELKRDNSSIASDSDWILNAGDQSNYYALAPFLKWIPAISGTYSLQLDVDGQSVVSQSIVFTLILSPQTAVPTAWSLINGVSAWEEPIEVCSGGPIIIDGSKSNTCGSQYFLSIELSDRWWHGYGGEYSQWLTKNDYQQYGPINAFDAKKWAEDHYFGFVPGQYYRVKLAVGSPWNEHTKVISIQPTVPRFSINGASGANIDVLGPAYPVVMDATGSSCAKGYFLSVQLSDVQLNRYGYEAMKWLTAADFSQYGPPASFDVKRFAEDRGLKFAPGQYYRVKLAVGPGWNDTTSLIFIKPHVEPRGWCFTHPCRAEAVPSPVP